MHNPHNYTCNAATKNSTAAAWILLTLVIFGINVQNFIRPKHTVSKKSIKRKVLESFCLEFFILELTMKHWHANGLGKNTFNTVPFEGQKCYKFAI